MSKTHLLGTDGNTVCGLKVTPRRMAARLVTVKKKLATCGFCNPERAAFDKAITPTIPAPTPAPKPRQFPESPQDALARINKAYRPERRPADETKRPWSAFA